jgi:hypothetical protein
MSNIVFKCNDLAQIICDFTDYNTQRSIKMINKKVKVTLNEFLYKFINNKNYRDYMYNSFMINEECDLSILDSIKIKSLVFRWCFNQSLYNVKLPNSLNSLDNVKLPNSLTSLDLGWDFNQSLDNVELPSSLTSLTFGYCFNQPFDNVKLPVY